jgi:hypothetical protein
VTDLRNMLGDGCMLPEWINLEDCLSEGLFHESRQAVENLHMCSAIQRVLCKHLMSKSCNLAARNEDVGLQLRES